MAQQLKSVIAHIAKEDPWECPVCANKAESTCRCRIGDKTCKNGHHWATCKVHGKVSCRVPYSEKLGYHTHPLPDCACYSDK